MNYLFGRFVLSMDGDEITNQIIPDRWQHPMEELPELYESIILHLTWDPSLPEKGLNDGWNLLDCGEKKQALYSKNGKNVFFLQYSSPEKEVSVCVRDSQKGCIKLAIQYGMMLALYRQCVGLHGVTLVCGNEIIILSAPSGTGKTTLAKLLERYCDAVVINGDFALLSPTGEGVIYEPTPFCGTSGRSLNHRFRINRVVFLGQAKGNVWRELTGREAMKQFMSNSFVPDWDSDVKLPVQENILRCVSSLKVDSYEFAPTKEAAEEFLRQVENDSSLRSE